MAHGVLMVSLNRDVIACGRYSDTYIDCVGNVIKSFCSMAAKSWQRKFDSKTLCPVLLSQGCLGWATQCREFVFRRPFACKNCFILSATQ